MANRALSGLEQRLHGKEPEMVFGIITMLVIIVIGVIFVRMVSRDTFK